MKIIIKLIILIVLISSCQKEIENEEVLYDLDFSSNEILADANSTVSISVILSEKTTSDRANIVFLTTRGTFKENDKDKFISKAEFESGKLIARATLKAPIRPGSIIISAKPEYDSPIQEYSVKDSIFALSSVPSTISLEPSSLGLIGNYESEIHLKGFLKNNLGNFVSSGYKVIFEDSLVGGGLAYGRFRNIKDFSNDSSSVSAYYATGLYPTGSTIKIVTTVLDSIGIKTNISDSVFINIIDP